MPTQKPKRKTVKKTKTATVSRTRTTKPGKYKDVMKTPEKTIKTKELSSKRRTGGGSKNTMVKQKTTYKKGPVKKTVIKGRVGSPKSVKTVTRRKYKS